MKYKALRGVSTDGIFFVDFPQPNVEVTRFQAFEMVESIMVALSVGGEDLRQRSSAILGDLTDFLLARVAMNWRNAEIHPVDEEREIARARAGAYQLVLDEIRILKQRHLPGSIDRDRCFPT